MHEPTAIVLVADGLRPETLDAAISAGDVPELAALRDTSGRHVVTTVFPSVTGVAYIPMLTGRHPAEAGVPGLRWYDRSRQLSALLGHSRSYVGTQLRRINHDLLPSARTLFERVDGHALGLAAMITRGLPRRSQLDRGVPYTVRVVHAHLMGDVARWAAIEEELASRLVSRVRRERPRFVYAAFTAGDKAAHLRGVDAPGVRQSLKLVDHVVGSIRRDAERDGRWSSMHLWVVSDHGHSAVDQHYDLADSFRDAGVKVRSHPWTVPDRSDAAVMVSGNGMAHVYLGLDSRTKLQSPALSRGWAPLIEQVCSQPAIDLVASQLSERTVEVRRGTDRAEIRLSADGVSYLPEDGNPLGIDPFESLCDAAAHERTVGTPYPDSVVQLARVALAKRSGDLVISASPGWDLRRRYEPIDHVSSHGALHAAHMLVPLLSNRRLAETPRRTADLHRLLLEALGFRTQGQPRATLASAGEARGV